MSSANAFQNARDVNVIRSNFSNVLGNQIINYRNRSAKPDLIEILAPVIDVGYDRSGPVSRCFPGTREEVIAEIVQWVQNDKNHPICWLKGAAGSGKSAIAQAIAERYASEKRLAGSFFFVRGIENRSDINRLIPTLSYQLSHSVPAAKPIIQSVIDEDPSITTTGKALTHRFQQLIIKPIAHQGRLKSLLSKLTPTKTAVIVIDALDECNDGESMGELIEIIIKACQETAGLSLRMLITSRIEEYIKKKLDTPAARSTVYHLSLDDFDARRDIEKYFRSSFDTICKENQRLLPGPWPAISDLSQLAKKSDGSFIFAVTLMDIIRRGKDRPEHRLQRALTAESGLDTLYAEVLSRASRDDHFQRVIGTIILLSSPLPITSLARLLRLDAQDVVQALLDTQSILMIPGDDDQPIRLYHTSLHDFLVAKSRSGKFFIDPPARHVSIAADCLAAISMPLENDIFYRAEPEQEYASVNWCYHLHRGLVDGWENLANALSDTSLITALQYFATHSFDFWINTLLLLNGYEKVLDILDGLLFSLDELSKCSQDFKICLENIQKYSKADIKHFEEYLRRSEDEFLEQKRFEFEEEFKKELKEKREEEFVRDVVCCPQHLLLTFSRPRFDLSGCNLREASAYVIWSIFCDTCC